MTKVFHIVENLDKGAVENYLVNVFLHLKKSGQNPDWVFYCVLGKQGRLDQKVLENGGKIVYCATNISDKLSFLRHLRATVKMQNPAIVHAHHDYLNGFYWIGLFGIKVKRVTHIHNADELLPVGSGFLRKILLRFFGNIVSYQSNLILGISYYTLDYFTSKQFFQPHAKGVLYYGIPMDNYECDTNEALLNKYPFLNKGKILLYSGRLNFEKNPSFLIDVMAELLKIDSSIQLLIAGKGDYEELIRKKIKQLNVEKNVHLIGFTDNLSALMTQADVFVFPRKLEPKEGLGLVIIEAQCAGLPIITTSGILDDAIIIKEQVFQIKLEKEIWVNQIIEILKLEKPDRAYSLNKMNESCFHLDFASEKLLNWYQFVLTPDFN
jgi:glycosyltransferase involved in cell wall biosynthesis